jgi:hypothetical protein
MKVYELMAQLANFPPHADVVFLHDEELETVRRIEDVSYQAVQPNSEDPFVEFLYTGPVPEDAEYVVNLVPEGV